MSLDPSQITQLQDLRQVVQEVAPKGLTVSSTQNPGDSSFLLEWKDDEGNLVAELVINVQPFYIVFTDLKSHQEDQGIFRSLCKILPGWSRQQQIPQFVVPVAESAQMQSLLSEAGFEQIIGTREWRADVSEEGCPVEVYGQAK